MTFSVALLLLAVVECSLSENAEFDVRQTTNGLDYNKYEFSFLASGNPGFAVRLTNSGLQYIRDLALDLLRKEVKEMSIPDQSGKEKVLIGKVHYTVSSIRVQDASVGSMDIKLVPGTGIRMSTSGFYLKLTGDWKWKTKGIFGVSDKGSVKFKMTVDLSITSTSEMGKDHLPTVSVVDCQFRVRGVDIDFRGGASWLYNLFTGFIEKPIKKNLEGQACPRITQMLNKSGQKVMDKMKLLLDIGNDMQLDLRLVASPVFGVSYMQSPHKGCFMFQGMSPSAFSPAPLDASEDLTSRMLYMFITEAMLNSGSAAYWQSGQLKLTIKPSIVRPNQFFNLDTNSIGILLPGSTLSSKYPNMEMLLNVSVPTAPKFDVSTDHVLSIIPAEVMAFVIQPDSSLIHVFTLEVTLNTTLSLWVENVKGRLHVGLSKNITVFHGDVTVKESNVGQSSGEKIEQLLNLAMPFLLAGIENRGIPLPTTPGLTFIRPEIRVVKGSIIIGTDINSQLP